MDLFSTKNISLIALDISDFSIEAVQLSQKRGGATFDVLSWSRTIIPKGIVDKGVVLDKENLSQIITKLIESPKFGEFSGRKVIFSVPESNVYSAEFKIPLEIKEEQMGAWLQKEIPKVLPFELQESLWDYYIVSASAGRMAFVVLAPKGVVEDMVLVMKQSRLLPLIAEPEFFGIVHCLEGGNVEKPMIVVDLGAYSTGIFIYDEKVVRGSCHVWIGGNTLTESIAKVLNISLKEAEIKKREIGLDIMADKEGFLVNLIQEGLQKVLVKMKSVIENYEKLTNRRIERVILNGGTSMIPMLTDYLSSNLNLEVGLMSNLPLGEGKSKDFANLFGVAFGLAKKTLDNNGLGVNFLKGNVGVKDEGSRSGDKVNFSFKNLFGIIKSR